MRWLFRRLKGACDEALAAKIQANIDYEIAEDQHKRVSEQADQLQRINQKNHFSEALRAAFGGEAS